MKNHIAFFILISLTSSLISLAQEAPKKQEILPAKIAIIAIGPKPPRRFGLVKGAGASSASALLPPKLGEIPPRRLHFSIKEKKDDKKSISITFNSPSHFIEVPANKVLTLLRKEKEEFSKYIDVAPLKLGSMNLVLLRPTGKGNKRWILEPKQYKINLLDEGLQEKKLVVVNLSHRAIKTIFHQEKKKILAGGVVTFEAIKGLELHRITATYGRKDKTIFNTALRFNKSDHLLIYVFYDANPNTNDGRTVGLFRTSVDRKIEKKEADLK